MARDPRYDVLFEPIQLGPKTLRNRFFQVPHCGAGSNRPGFQAELRAMKAEGGWAAVFTEVCSVSPDSDLTNIAARLWDEGDVRNLAPMCDAVHEHDSLAGVELGHLAGQPGNGETRMGGRTVSAVSVPSIVGVGSTARGITKREIRELQHEHVEGFKRARAAGFDLLTLYAGHAVCFPNFFLLPIYNRRTDEYGGSFENRIRFTRELLEMLREEIDDCAIGMRFNIDTLDEPYGFGDRGVRADGEGKEFIAALDSLVDYWDLVTGTANWGENGGSSRWFEMNHEAPYTRVATEVTAKPVINVGRFTDPDVMVRAITSRQCDIIGAARPSIADPFLPQKIEEGRLDDIRECIACNVCVSRNYLAGSIACTQNATIGEEYRRGWHPERFTRAANADNDILVVGAGPAGMECARVLGERQMRRVHLVDAERELGGHLRWVTTLPGLGTWGRVINYRQIQLGKLRNVHHIPGTRLSVDEVLDYGADYVVLATGSRWHPQGLNGYSCDVIEGADATMDEHILTPEQVVAQSKPVGDRVVVYDVEGYFMAASVAELLARQGKSVTYVTPFAKFAQYLEFTLEEQRQHQTLHGLGVKIVVNTMVTQVGPEAVQTADVWTEELASLPCESVVLVTQRNGESEIYDELIEAPERLEAADIKGLFLIGDAHTPGLIAQAVFSGHRLAREIDSDNPAVPLPFIRERRLWGATSNEDYDGELRIAPDTLRLQALGDEVSM